MFHRRWPWLTTFAIVVQWLRLRSRPSAIGNSLGVILPNAILDRLRVSKGDSLFIIETPNGTKLTTCDREFAARMEVAEQAMRQKHDVLRKLAE